ncbi:hypothetical protein FGB62_113g113 [Gracilaria domingensis]|nr:hypothetical protein FGB62_113g113 [Gracilaria domingensis]
MPSSSSQAPLPVLPPLRSVRLSPSKSSKQPVNNRSRARDKRQPDASPHRRKPSSSRSRSSSDSLDSSSSESSRSSSSSSSSSSSAHLPSRSASYSSSSNYHSSTPSSPRNRSALAPNRSLKPSVQKVFKRATIRKRQNSGNTLRGKPSHYASKPKQNAVESGSSRVVPLSIRSKTCESAAEIVGRSAATIGEALDQLAVLSSIPRRRGRPSKSVIEQRNRLQTLRERLDSDIDRLSTATRRQAATATSATRSTTTKTAKTGKKSCKQPSGSVLQADAPQGTGSSDQVTKRRKKTSSTTKTTTVTYIESSSSSSEEKRVKPVAKKRQRAPSSDGKLDTRKTKRLMSGTSAMLTTVGTLTNKAGGASPRKRAEKAPKSSLLKESAEKEKRDKSLSRDAIDDEDSDEDDENEDCMGDDDDEDEGAITDKAEGEDGCEKNDKTSSCREKPKKDDRDEKIESMQDELDELKDRLQKEIYRAAELEEALGLDIKAQVASAEEVQSMKSRIEGLEQQVKGLQATIEQNEDQVREKDAALRGLIAQVKDLEGRQCERCSMKNDNEGAQEVETKKEWKTDVERLEESEEMEELKRYANETSAKLKRVLQVNRRMQQKMFRLRRGEVDDNEMHDSI